MHAIEKIISKGSGVNNVQAGDIVMIDVDIAGINDLYPQALYSFRQIGAQKVWNPEKVVFFFDH